MTFTDYRFSKHLAVDRQTRLEAIESIIGFGTIIEKVVDPRDNRTTLFSDTGIVGILDTDNKTIVTMFVIKYHKAKAIFKGVIPTKIFKAIQYNRFNLTDTEKIRLGLDNF